MNGILSRAMLAVTLLLGSALLSFAQKQDDKAAAELLANARRLQQDRKFAEAANQFRNFLNRFPTSKHAPDAQYGLALALLEAADPDFVAIQDPLKKLEPIADFAERRFVLYHLGRSLRGVGIRELLQAASQPQIRPQLEAAARRHFAEAEQQFARAAEAFAAHGKNAPQGPSASADRNGNFRSRCGQIEMMLRTGRLKEANAALTSLLADPRLPSSPVRGQAYYYQGVVAFLANDDLVAGRALNRLAPFQDPALGTHAQYLLGRVHEQAEEEPEAARAYEEVIAAHERARQQAADTLKRPELLTPRERGQLEALRRDPAPEHVARAGLRLGALYYSAGRFGDAQVRFADFLKQFPRSPLASEAQLRLGMCQVQNKQFPEALRTLQPLLASGEGKGNPRALCWIGRAQAGAATPEGKPVNAASLKDALATLRTACEAMARLESKDEDLARLRSEGLLIIADTEMQADLFKEAAASYAKVVAEGRLPEQGEEALQRQATALHFAGDYDSSDRVCEAFRQKYPSGLFLAAVAFRHAENAAFRLAAAEREPARAGELPALRAETLRRYQVLADRYPDFPYTNYAHYSRALIYCRGGEWEKAKAALEAIPAPDRTGELAAASSLLADILIRLAPAKADDALAAGRLEEQLKAAIELLDGFVGSSPKDARTPEALVKLGYCQLRWAALLVQPRERGEALLRAKSTFDRLRNEFAQHDAGGWGLVGRGQVGLLMGDVASAERYLQRFANDPFRRSSAAPVGAIEMAALLRRRGRSADAAALTTKALADHEAALTKAGDPHGWVAKLRLQQALALRESGKLPEARKLFETLAKQAPPRVETAEASLRLGQILAHESLAAIEPNLKQLASRAGKPEERMALQKNIAAGLGTLQDAIKHLETEADRLRKVDGGADLCARMLYEAAWMERHHANLQRDAGLPVARPRTEAVYQKLVATFPDAPLALEARFELAELARNHGDPKKAIQALDELLEKEPAADLLEKIAVLRGSCLAAQGDVKGAQEQFEVVVKNPKSPLAPMARLQAGEALLQAGDVAGAAKHLAVFRDQDPYRRMPGADRALLRLGQAYGGLKLWDRSRDAFEQAAQRFGQTPATLAAGHALGWVYQNQKNYRAASDAYARLAGWAPGEFGAIARVQQGLCLIEQKRFDDAAGAFSQVRRYELPEWTAFALVESARARILMKQTEQAEKLLAEIEKDFGKTKAASVVPAYRKALKAPATLPPVAVPAVLTQPLPPGFKLPELVIAGQQPEKPSASLEGIGPMAFLAAFRTNIPSRTTPAPFLRLTLPDPFEHRRAARLPAWGAEPLPLVVLLP